jgi:hypothetical protein
MPRKGFWPKRAEEIMNPAPIILSTSAEPEDMQEAFWLITKGTSGVRNPQVTKARPQRESLEKQAPNKMSNFGLGDGFPNHREAKAPLVVRRLQVPSLVERINHRKMGREPAVSQPWLKTGDWSGRIPLPVLPPRANRVNTQFVKHMGRHHRN